MNRINLLCAFFIVLFLASCSQEQRDLKKFEGRLNAGEYACASVYLYDGDLPSFSFFCNEIRKKNPNLLIRQISCTDGIVDGNSVLFAEFELVNSSKAVRRYFNNIGYELSPDYTFKDTIIIRETNDGKKLSFNWGMKHNDENSYQLAHITGDNVEKLNIRKSPDVQSLVVGKLNRGDDILIDNTGEDAQWVHGYMVNSNGDIVSGYIQNTQLGKTTSSFFSLGIFDSMTLLGAILVFVLICVFFVFGSSLFAMVSSIPVAGIAITIVCILLLIYSAYQLLEKILFELFLINLPY